jgi:putative tryptophan/tyrosine transport system substrate-binding protein
VAAVARATTTIPIVGLSKGDPVAVGLVASLARPGGNVTGVADLQGEPQAKRTEILKETIPGIRRLALLTNPAHPDDRARGLPNRSVCRLSRRNVSSSSVRFTLP